MPATLFELAQRTGTTVDGDGTVTVSHVATLEAAGPGAIAFLSNPKYKAQLAGTRASAVIVSAEFAERTALPKVVSPNPYVTYAKVAAILHPAATPAPGIAATAVVDPTAGVAASASIGANAVIGARTAIGERSRIGAGCVVGADVSIAEDTVLHANVTVYDRCVIGPRAMLHSGVVIGADGFGMAEEGGRWIKIPQIGRVVIGADVEIGANTTIDRGALGDTVIEDDVKLDNLVQVGHNCRIGAHTAVAGCVGIAGSTVIGRNCKLGGAAMINGHIEICDEVLIWGATPVRHSITTPGAYSGAIPAVPYADWVRMVSNLRKLRELAHRVRALERAAGAGEEHDSAAEGER